MHVLHKFRTSWLSTEAIPSPTQSTKSSHGAAYGQVLAVVSKVTFMVPVHLVCLRLGWMIHRVVMTVLTKARPIAELPALHFGTDRALLASSMAADQIRVVMLLLVPQVALRSRTHFCIGAALAHRAHAVLCLPHLGSPYPGQVHSSISLDRILTRSLTLRL